MTDDPGHPTHPPTHEALWPADIFKDGIGWVIVAHFKAEGRRVQAGIFLVDVFCLGVKNAFYEDCDVHDYRERIRGHYESEFSMVPAEPCCARKLVEQAVQYALALGLEPHSDYRKASGAFRGLETAQCAQQFTFGSKGKPFYRNGPRETEAQAQRILSHLERRCGPGNYDFLISLGDADEISRFLGD